MIKKVESKKNEGKKSVSKPLKKAATMTPVRKRVEKALVKKEKDIKKLLKDRETRSSTRKVLTGA